MTIRSVQYTGSVFVKQQHGGISRYIVELARNILASESWSASIASPLFINEYLRTERATIGHRGIHLPCKLLGLPQLNSALTWCMDVARFRQLPTVRHEMYFNPRSLEKCNSVRISTFFDMIHERFKLSSLMTARKMRTASASDAIVAISESTKGDMIDIFNIAPERIKVIYLAADTVFTNTPPPVTPENPYILWVGNRYGHKNFDLLARAFVRTRASRDGATILLAGGKPPSGMERKTWLAYGLSESDVLHTNPSESDLSGLYSFAQMLIYCSKYEGFGIPPLEAMQCHCPVICSNTSSLPEVVGDAAIQISPNDAEQLASAIDTVYDSQDLRNDLVHRGLANVERFSWEKCAQEHIDLYNSLL